MIEYVMDYCDHVKRFDPEINEAWTELSMSLTKSGAPQKLLQAMDKLENSNVGPMGWDDRVAKLLAEAIPVDLSQALKEEAERVEFKNMNQYSRAIDRINNLLLSLNSTVIDDATLIRSMEKSMQSSSSENIRSLLTSWTKWSMDADRGNSITFEQANRRITSYEQALEKSNLLAKNSQSTNSADRGSQNPKTAEEKWGMLCDYPG